MRGKHLSRIAAVATLILAVSLPLSFYWAVFWTAPGHRFIVCYHAGVLQGHNYVEPSPVQPSYWGFELGRLNSPIRYHALPRLHRDDVLYPAFWQFSIPVHTLLVPLLAVAAYPFLPFVVRRKRRQRGQCVKCGYDLTGNASGACSECGQAFDTNDSRTSVRYEPLGFWRRRFTVLPVCLVTYWILSVTTAWAFGPYQWDVAWRLQGPIFLARVSLAMGLPVTACCIGLIIAHPLKPTPATALLTVLGFLLWYGSSYLGWLLACSA